MFLGCPPVLPRSVTPHILTSYLAHTVTYVESLPLRNLVLISLTRCLQSCLKKGNYNVHWQCGIRTCKECYWELYVQVSLFLDAPHRIALPSCRANRENAELQREAAELVKPRKLEEMVPIPTPPRGEIYLLKVRTEYSLLTYSQVIFISSTSHRYEASCQL